MQHLAMGPAYLGSPAYPLASLRGSRRLTARPLARILIPAPHEPVAATKITELLGNPLAYSSFISYVDVLMDADQIAELIARAQQRDPAAFDALVGAYSARLYGYFYRLTGSRHDAEDLLQELFVRLVRMVGEYRHDGRFDAWLFRIATNLVRDRLRRAKKTPAVGLDLSPTGCEGTAWAQQPDHKNPDPSEVVHRAEQVDQLQRAIGELPEAEREVILLRHFSQVSFREIADLMGTPLGTALARAHRGLLRLRQLMEEQESG